MDFITHSLIGAGAARLIAPRRDWIPQLSLCGVLGSLVMDNDSWLYLLGPNHYGLYHRVITHSVIGLVASALIAAGISRAVAAKAPWRRFGWFVSDNLNNEETPPTAAPFTLYLIVASIAAFLHFCGDVITGFGNMTPFWPWNKWDASLHIVNSFSVVIFSATLLWHICLRKFGGTRRREVYITLAWAALVVGYLAVRWYLIAQGIVRPAFI